MRSLELLSATTDAFIFNKPRGLSCVSLSEYDPSAVSLACGAQPELRELKTGVEGRPNEHGLLHRLDRDTTGCLAFARTAEAYTRLRKLWHEAEKLYRTIVIDPSGFWLGRPLPISLDWPLAASAKSKKKMLVLGPDRPGILRSTRGHPLRAETLILCALPLADPSSNAFDLTVQIRTGVRHQIRAHLAAAGTPLLHDPIYKKSESELLPAKPFFLHAWKLALPGHALIECPLPADWPLQ